MTITSTTEIARLKSITAIARVAERGARVDALEAEARARGEQVWFGRLHSDEATWASLGVHTGYDLERSLAFSEYSDWHKELYGVRPRPNRPLLLEEIEARLEDLEAVAEARADEWEDDDWDYHYDQVDDGAEAERLEREEMELAQDLVWMTQDILNGIRARY